MTFNVTADAYAEFMGRYAEPLAERFLEFADVRAGQRALDVGCGPGALTARLAERLGASSVAAIDPSAPFVAATRMRLPQAEVASGVAERLPFPDNSFDCVLAQLVVHFMTDPVAGLREMARVAGPVGSVAACVWDHAGDGGPLSAFWKAVQEVDLDVRGESDLAGAREGHLAELCQEAGLRHVESATLIVRVGFATFDDWWTPFTLGVGPAGAYVTQLDETRRASLRARCEQRLPAPPFEVAALAWAVRARW